MEKQYFVYILTNPQNRVLYVGVTNNLFRRISEHKSKEVEGFTKKYNCTKLVHYEETDDVHEALTREKQLKSWNRAWKVELISAHNPGWHDLSNDIGLDA